MHSKSFGLPLTVSLLLCVIAGCSKSGDTSSGGASPSTTSQIQAQSQAKISPPLNTIARVHWLGMKRLAAETNAAYFMTIWNLPETARLEAQTLDKLALWLSVGNIAATNGEAAGRGPAPVPGAQQPSTNTKPSSMGSDISQSQNQKSKTKESLLLRPLLDDLINEECYLEIGTGTNQPSELTVAIRLDPAHSRLWETNLASALESLTGAHPNPVAAPNASWQMVITATGSSASSTNSAPNNLPLSLAFSRTGSWTLLSLGGSTNATLPADFHARISHDGAPFAASATNFWLDANFDLKQVSTAFALNWKLPDKFPKTALTIVGDGQDVRSHGIFEFPNALALDLEPWIIPTNVIHDPLIGFTAVRGFRPWLDSWKPWKDLQIGATPNQICIWDHEGMPAQEYCAAPFAQASNVVQRLSDRLLQIVNPWAQAERFGQLQWSTNSDGIVWRRAPFISPQLRSADEGQGGFALLSLIVLARTNLPAPAELLGGPFNRSNVLCYDWEITGPGFEHWLYLGQLARFLFHKAQLPTESASFHWVKAAAPKLGNCITLVNANSPDHLELVRRSSVGLSSIELHLLADWLESPYFPHGLHTFLGPLPPVTPLASTNSTTQCRK